MLLGACPTMGFQGVQLVWGDRLCLASRCRKCHHTMRPGRKLHPLYASASPKSWRLVSRDTSLRGNPALRRSTHLTWHGESSSYSHLTCIPSVGCQVTGLDASTAYREIQPDWVVWGVHRATFTPHLIPFSRVTDCR